LTEGEVNHVRSGSRIDGDGKVVGRHVEVEMAMRQDIQLCLLVVDVEEQTQLFYRAKSS
jgi:hypothetical protein